MIRGRSHAKSFRFPYQDDAFDFVIVTSVFTHLLCSEVEHCLDEIRSVHYGNWCGRREGLSYQDIIVAQRS